MSDQGASPGEQLIEAARRNNTELLTSIKAGYTDPKEFAKLVNDYRDATGNTALHLCCRYGCFEVMDELLDNDEVDANPTNPMTGDTPLHVAANYSFEEPDYALFLMQQLIEVGADPTIRNKEGMRPADIVGDSNEKIKMTLHSAEYAMTAQQGVEVVDEDEDDGDQ